MRGEEVTDGHASTEEEPDLCRRDVVLDGLADKEDVVSPRSQSVEGLVDVGAGPLDNKSTVSAENTLKLYGVEARMA